MSSSPASATSSTTAVAAAAAAVDTPASAWTANAPTYFFISPRYRTFTFSAGFLCGQASLIIVAVLFLRYVVFEDPTVALREAGKRKKKRLRSSASKRQRRASSSSTSRKAPLFSGAATLPTTDRLILEKLTYDLSSHPSESLDWLNVLLAQACLTYRAMLVAKSTEPGGRGPKGFVEDALNGNRAEGEQKQGIVTLDYITVTEVDFGEEYPVFSNARVRPSTESGKVRIEVDVDYSDHVSLSVETKVCLNFPKPKFGIIPVSLALALVRFSATLTIEIPPPSFVQSAGIPDSSATVEDFVHPQSRLSLSLHPDFILELASTSLIGSRAKLQDIPKVEQLIISRIRNWVVGNFVWPKVKNVPLPNLGGSKESSTAATSADTSRRHRGGLGSHRDRAESPPDGDDFVFIDKTSKGVKSFENGDAATSPDSTSAVDDESEDDDELDEDDDADEDLGPNDRRPDQRIVTDFRLTQASPRSTREYRPGKNGYSEAVSPTLDLPSSKKQRLHSSKSPSTSANSSSSQITVEAFSSALEAEDAHEQHSQQHLSHRKYSRSSAPTTLPTSSSRQPKQTYGFEAATSKGNDASSAASLSGSTSSLPVNGNGNGRQRRTSSLTVGGNRTTIAGPDLSVTASSRDQRRQEQEPKSPSAESESGATSTSDSMLTLNRPARSGTGLYKDALFRSAPPLHSPGLGLGYAGSRTSSSQAVNELSASTSGYNGQRHTNSGNTSPTTTTTSLNGSNFRGNSLHRSTSSVGSNASTITGQLYQLGASHNGGLLSPRPRDFASSASSAGNAGFPGFFEAEPRWEAARRAAARDRRNSPA